MQKAFVLLSGGIDSSTALALATDRTRLDHENEHPVAISIDYGQRHKKELTAAANVVVDLNSAFSSTRKRMRIEHRVITLPPSMLGGAMLTGGGQDIPNAAYDQLPEGVSPTYVPFRNGTLLALLAAEAQKWVNEARKHVPVGDLAPEAVIYFGAHAEDAHRWAYPDCTPEFIGAMANAIYVGTYHAVRLCAPFQHMQKHEIIELGKDLVRYELTWSCYAGGEKHCGVCPTCRARKDAFARAGVTDPTEYAT